MKKQLSLILFLIISFSFYSLSQTNSWNGSYNSYWHNNNNWSLGHIPLSIENVVITSSGYTCSVDYYDETCASLSINSGATLIIADQKLAVSGNVNISGTLNMNNTASELDCVSITWLSGSSASMTGSATIYVSGTWEFALGSEVFLTSGYVNFDGTGNSFIRSNDDDSHFNHIRNYKSSGFLGNSGQSTYPLDINGNIYCYANTQLQSFSAQPIELAGFINNMSGHIYMNNGTFKFDGGSSTSQFMPGDYFNNLTIASTGTKTFADDIEVKGTLRLESGILSPGATTITVGGNWENVAGTGAFSEGTSRVIFNGSSHQYCNYDENFYTLEVNKSAGALRVNSSTAEVYCAAYDWTAGAVDILQGTFTADDLIDSSIQGGWYLNDGGEINLTNTVGYVDLAGDVHIYGGTMNVYGGQDDSYWPIDSEASIEMSGGSFKFQDVGIYIRNNGVLTENITGGMISTVGNLRLDRSDFNPSGGHIAMFGMTETYVKIDNGLLSQLSILKTSNKSINTKSIPTYEYENDGIQPVSITPEMLSPCNFQQKGIYLSGFTGRDGITYTPVKSNSVVAYDDIELLHISISIGTFDPNGHLVNLLGDMLISNVGNLQMTHAADHINLRDMLWYSGSTANITSGLLTVRRDWNFKDGTYCQISPGNTVVFDNEGGADHIKCQDADAKFGTVILDDAMYIDGVSTQPMRVAGDLTINSSKTLYIQDRSLIVDGTFDIQNGAVVSVYSALVGGSVENYSDFTLNGELDVGIGDVTIHGDFNLMPTGILTIDGGTFFRDQLSQAYNSDMQGTFNLYDGTFDVTNNGYNWDCASSTISGGVIKCRAAILEASGDFHPTGGSVEFYGYYNSLVYCLGDNYFWDFVVNRTGNNLYMYSDLKIKNDLIINSGNLNCQQPISYEYFDVYIEGDWNTDGAFNSGQGNVYFTGNVSSDILTGEGFYNLIINKTYSNYDGVEINDTYSLYVDGDLQILDGTVELNPGSNLDVAGNIAIYNSAGLNANDDYTDVSVGLDWVNYNTVHTSTWGFDPGNSSTVTFDGSVDQHISTAAPIEDFFNLVIDKSGGKLKANDSTQVYGDFTINDGEWRDESINLNHYYWGDISVSPGAIRGYQSGATNYLLGTSDQTLTDEGTMHFFNLIVDKSVSKGLPGKFQLDDGSFAYYEPGSNNGSKSQVVSVAGNGIVAYYPVIEEGTLDLTSAGMLVSYDATINDGGTISVGPGSWLSCGDGTGTTINSGGELLLIGLPGQEATFESNMTSNATSLIVNSGGTIGAEYTDFLRLNSTGIVINSGAVVNTSYPFNYCSFKGNEAGGSLLTINNSQNITIDHAGFPPNIWGGTYNVAKTLNQGNVTFTNVDPASGFAGEDFENDAYNRINWPDVIRGKWTGLESHIWNDPDNWEYHLKPGPTDDVYIPAGVPNMPWVSSTDQECNNVTIEAGASLRVYDEILTVHNDLDIFGLLQMDHASGVLQVENDIIWEAGSSASMTAGLVEVTQGWYFNDGTNCQIGTGNVVKFMPSSPLKSIFSFDSDAQFGSVIVDASNLYLDGYNTEPVHVAGNLTVNPSRKLWMQNKDMVVDGTIDIQNGGTIEMSGLYSGASLENNSDFTLNGILDVGLGDVTIHGEFDIAATGDLTIAGGSFTYDTGIEFCDIYGALNMSDGLFQPEEGIYFRPAATSNITGGLIRATAFRAESPGNFEPIGGTVEIQTTNSSIGAIYCSDGNYFYDLKINPLLGGGGHIYTDVLVQNDVEVMDGTLDLGSHELTVNNNVVIYSRLGMSSDGILNAGDSFGDQIIWKTGSTLQNLSGTINVFGDWTFENGISNPPIISNTVNFYGTNNSVIHNLDPDIGFANISINKTSSIHNLVEIPAGTKIRVNGNINVNDGELKINENVELYVQQELNVNDGGVLSSLGSAGNEPLISGYFSANCLFEINSGATIRTVNTIFKYFEGPGVHVVSGSTIDPLYPFNNCTFTNGYSGSTLLTIENSQILTIDGVIFPENTWSGAYNVAKTNDQGEITFTNFSGAFSDETFENDPYNRIIWDHEDFYLNVRLYLEGPFNATSGMMNPTLNSTGLIPLSQPFNTAPWNYPGSESVASFDPTTIDWVLLELRDAPDAASATPATTIARRAVFVKTNGYLVELAGTGFPVFNVNITQNLFVVVWHRNHLGIMSANPLVESGGIYTYDFRGSASQAYGGTAGYTQLLPSGYWGMVGGDGNSDGEVTQFDKASIWSLEAGSTGYKAGDYNLNGQVGNQDKNDVLIKNFTKESQVPD